MIEIEDRLEQVLELVPPSPPLAELKERARRRRRLHREQQAIALVALCAVLATSAIALARRERNTSFSVSANRSTVSPTTGPLARVDFGPPMVDGDQVADDVVYGDGSVWVRRSGSVERLSPTGRRLAQIAVPGEGDPESVLAMSSAVWVGSSYGRLVRIDPRTNRVVRSLAMEAQSLTQQGGLLWVRTPSEFVAVDPRTDHVVRRFSRLNQSQLAATRDALWLINGCACLERIDPRTLRITDVHVEATSIVATTADTLWINTNATTLVEIDARTAHRLGSPIDVHGVEPTAAVQGHVLFVSSLSNAGATLAAYDTRTHALFGRSEPTPSTVMVRVAATPTTIWIIGDRLIHISAAITLI